MLCESILIEFAYRIIDIDSYYYYSRFGFVVIIVVVCADYILFYVLNCLRHCQV